MSNELIKVEAYVDQIRFPKERTHEGGYTIATFIPDSSSASGKGLKLTKYGVLSCKGEMIRLKRGIKYSLLIKEGETHPTFGTTYEVISMSRSFDFSKATPQEIRSFLATLMTEEQLDSYYEVFGEDPMKPLIDEDTKSLQKVKGIGEVYSELIMKRYLDTKDMSEAYIRLARYSLSPSEIKLLISHCGGDVELAEEMIKEDPYQFMLSIGFSFFLCDKMYALDGGAFDSDIRYRGIMIAGLLEAVEKGDTWIEPSQIVLAVKSLVPTVDAKHLGKILIEDEVFNVSEDKTRLALQKYVDLEKRVASKLIRMQSYSRPSNPEKWMPKVRKIEEEQGWNFSDQQIEALEMMMSNNVSILEGYGGTGKTTIVKTLLDLLPEDFAVQCALSGKASDNLAKVTGRPGYTIRRLLLTETDEQGNLPHTIVIVDEFGMVDLELFDELLEAIDSNAKLIMIGDCEQLEAIGIPLMKQLINTEKIPYKMLTEIHRQAKKSAVITDSIKIRNGENIFNENERVGYFVHGELQDLHLHLLQDDSASIQRAIDVFKKKIETESINDIQILSQTVEVSKKVNELAKEAYNPIDYGKPQTSRKRLESEDGSFVYVDDYNYIDLRNSRKSPLMVSVGDKVICKKNNYTTFKYGEFSFTPIFNGNTGVIKAIMSDEEFGKIMLIDFDGTGTIVVTEEMWPTIDLAYCITVHKSQGSSCKVIIAIIVSHRYLNVRQLLYTGITRVKEEGHLISTRETIEKAIITYNSTYRKNYLTGYYLELIEEKVKEEDSLVAVIKSE